MDYFRKKIRFLVQTYKSIIGIARLVKSIKKDWEPFVVVQMPPQAVKAILIDAGATEEWFSSHSLLGGTILMDSEIVFGKAYPGKLVTMKTLREENGMIQCEMIGFVDGESLVNMSFRSLAKVVANYFMWAGKREKLGLGNFGVNFEERKAGWLKK